MSACHNEVLAMVCAHDKLSIDDPRKLFAKCLDPPTSEVVDNAIDFLVEIDACQKVKSVFDFMNRGAAEKISPTDYGTLLSSLSMSVAEARIVLEGGKLGLLRNSCFYGNLQSQTISNRSHFW
jgi:peptide subunit release factor 1 (eRF1)